MCKAWGSAKHVRDDASRVAARSPLGGYSSTRPHPTYYLSLRKRRGGNVEQAAILGYRNKTEPEGQNHRAAEGKDHELHIITIRALLSGSRKLRGAEKYMLGRVLVAVCVFFCA